METNKQTDKLVKAKKQKAKKQRKRESRKTQDKSKVVVGVVLHVGPTLPGHHAHNLPERC